MVIDAANGADVSEAIFQAHPAPMAITRLSDGRIQKVNGALEALTGLSRERMIGATTVELGLMDVPTRNRLLDELRATGSVRGAEVWARSGNRAGWLEFHMVPVPGPVPLLLTVLVDTTERRTREEALRRRETDLALAMTLARAGYWEFEVSSATFWFSDEYLEVLMGTTAEVFGRRKTAEEFARVCVHPSMAHVVADVLSKAIAAPDPSYSHQFEAVLVRPSGDTVDVLVELRVATDDQGRVVKLYGVNLDITDRKRVERELVMAKDAAEAAAVAKSAFLAHMSHEIRTPLNGILGLGELLQATNLDGVQRSYVDSLTHSGSVLLQLLNDVLDYSKLEAARLELEQSPLDPSELIKTVLEVLRPSAAERGITLHADVDPSLPRHFVGDPGRVRQILLNLVGNALKFTPRGSVRVVARPCPTGGISLEVQDTGIGISAEQQERLFQAFRQGDSTMARRFGGTGLGLAICKGLVDRMGGNIEVSSTLGQGSCFRVILPLRIAEVAAPARTRPPGLPQLPSMRVLVAEDTAVSQIVIRGLLQKLGATCVLVADGEAAVRAMVEGRFDLVLMDCQMPTMDGYEAARRIREREAATSTPRTPIIALTAHALEGDRTACLDAGMDDYLAKPVSMQKLAALLASYAPRG